MSGHSDHHHADDFEISGLSECCSKSSDVSLMSSCEKSSCEDPSLLTGCERETCPSGCEKCGGHGCGRQRHNRKGCIVRFSCTEVDGQFYVSGRSWPVVLLEEGVIYIWCVQNVTGGLMITKGKTDEAFDGLETGSTGSFTIRCVEETFNKHDTYYYKMGNQYGKIRIV